MALHRYRCGIGDVVSGYLNQLPLYGGCDRLLSNAVMAAASREEFGKWLRSVFGRAPQVGLGTYTFRDPDTGLNPMRSTNGRQYVSLAGARLACLLQESGSTYFICVEVGSDTRRLHLHSLESNDLRVRNLIHSWWKKKYGFESYKEVDSLRGVSLYVTKYVTKTDMPFWAGGPLYQNVEEGVKAAAVPEGDLTPAEG